MSGVSGVVTVLPILMIAAVVFLLVYRARKNREQLRLLANEAQRNGWAFEPRNDTYVTRFLGYPFSAGGMSRRVQSIVHGDYRGYAFFACQFSYTESNGQSSSTRRFVVVALRTPAPRPTLQVARENAMTGLLDKVGHKDLQLESDAFNDAYRIKAENDRFAYDVLHPRMMEFLLADQRAWQLPFRFERADVLTWRAGRFDLREALWMREFLCDLLDRVPGHVWR